MTRNLSRSQDISLLNRKNLVDHVQHRRNSRSDSFTPPDRCIPAQDFLQYLRIGYQSAVVRNRAIQQHLRQHLIRMRSAHQIHRDIRIDKDHS